MSSDERVSLRTRVSQALRTSPTARGRRVRRTVRHVEPWSVLKLSLLFSTAVFLILCVASGILWGAARVSGTLDNVEDFITSVAAVGECEPIAGFEPEESTSTTPTTVSSDDGSSQLDPTRDTADPDDDTPSEAELEEELAADIAPGDDDDCKAGTRLVGGFKFEDLQIFTAVIFGGLVLILAATGATVVLALLFNLMSDLTGGVQVTVIEEDQRPRRPPEAGSQGPKPRD